MLYSSWNPPTNPCKNEQVSHCFLSPTDLALSHLANQPAQRQIHEDVGIFLESMSHMPLLQTVRVANGSKTNWPQSELTPSHLKGALRQSVLSPCQTHPVRGGGVRGVSVAPTPPSPRVLRQAGLRAMRAVDHCSRSFVWKPHAKRTYMFLGMAKHMLVDKREGLLSVQKWFKKRSGVVSTCNLRRGRSTWTQRKSVPRPRRAL